jgi:hypothetical protein
MYAKRAAEQGRGFLERIRPSGELESNRAFLAETSKALNDLQPGEWVALWSMTGQQDVKAYRVADYPGGRWTDAAMFFERIKVELEGIVGSDLASPFIKDVSKKLGICNGND